MRLEWGKNTQTSLSSLPIPIRTTVLVGMHGSGLTNALYLQRGAVLLQIMPFKTGPCVVCRVLCAVVLYGGVWRVACVVCVCGYLTNNNCRPIYPPAGGGAAAYQGFTHGAGAVYKVATPSPPPKERGITIAHTIPPVAISFCSSNERTTQEWTNPCQECTVMHWDILNEQEKADKAGILGNVNCSPSPTFFGHSFFLSLSLFLLI
jgi:hypothetical protein